jgi:alginate O-acetyltransferase complex protein AlgI
MAVTFGLTTLAWIFFRSESVPDALAYIGRMFSSSLFEMPDARASIGGSAYVVVTLLLIVFFLVVEWLGREQQYALAKFGVRWMKPVRWAMYYVLLIAIFLFMGKEQQFIYFQF